MNNWIGIGRLTRDIDVRYAAQTQKAVARFTLAIDDGYGENKKTNFISIVAFGKTAENLEKFSGKGLRIAIIGHIQTGSYEKDGQKVYSTDIVADRIEFIDWKNSEKVSEPDGEYPQGFEEMTEDCPF